MEWKDMSDHDVVAYITGNHPLSSQNAAIAEMQRRLVVAMRAASDSSDSFAAQAQKLNTSIRFYTIALFFLGLVQIGLMFWKG